MILLLILLTRQELTTTHIVFNTYTHSNTVVLERPPPATPTLQRRINHAATPHSTQFPGLGTLFWTP
jgi:hypothetical protein